VIRMQSPGKRAAALLVDRALSVVAPLIVPGRSATTLPPAPRVLLVRCDHIGDAAMGTAVLQPLRATLQPSHLDVLAGPWAASLFDGHPAVDETIVYATPWWLAARGAPRAERRAAWRALPTIIRRLRRNRYDIGIELRGDLRQVVFFLALPRIPIRVSSDRTGGRQLLTHIAAYTPGRHEVELDRAIVATLGVDPASCTPDLGPLPALPMDTERRVSALGEIMVLALRGNHPYKAWPPENAAALVDRAARELGLAAVVVGGPGEHAIAADIIDRARAPVLDLTGALTLREMAALCRRSAVTVAVDSGPMHVAAAAGAAVVGLFGSTDPTCYRPWGERTRVASVNAPCGCAPPRCRFASGSGQCMRQLTPDAVVDAIRGLA